MLQTASTLNYQPFTARVVKPLPNQGHDRRAEIAKRPTNDLSVLYPQSVLKSSDAIGWQNVRAIHFRHTSREVLIPSSDDHCIVKNLGTPFFMNVYPGKRRFEGKVLSNEPAIIPAGSSWVCRSEGPEPPTMLLLYMR